MLSLGLSLLSIELFFEGTLKYRDKTSIVKGFGSLFPPFGFGYGIVNLIDLAYHNGRCKAIGDDILPVLCSSSNVTEFVLPLTICCGQWLLIPIYFQLRFDSD